MSQTTPLTADEREMIRKLQRLCRVGVKALNDSDWRIGMTAEDAVIPVMLALLIEIGERLPLTELSAAKADRCRSCDHLVELHHEDGCAYTVGQVELGAAPACPCVVPRPAST